MGGFSSQVQQPQTSQPQNAGGKGSPIASAVDQVASAQRQDGLDQNAINADPQGFQQWQQQAAQQPPQPMGKGGRQTNSATSGQPRMGMQNQYSNTVGQWDNSQIQPLQPKNGGKGKGG
jgi:hypothetical protein